VISNNIKISLTDNKLDRLQLTFLFTDDLWHNTLTCIYMNWPPVDNSGLFCGVVNGNQVGVAMQRFAPVNSIGPLNWVKTQEVAAISFADVRKIGRTSYNTANESFRNMYRNSASEWKASQVVHHYSLDPLDAPSYREYRRLPDNRVDKIVGPKSTCV